MLDLLARTPIRLGILGALVVSAAAGDCGYVRPTYLRPGGVGSTTPVTPIPAWNGRDTAATYVSGFVGRGATFNGSDDNHLAGGYLHRSWAREHMGWSVGALAYDGRYALADPTGLPAQRMGFSGAGGVIGFNGHLRANQLELRPVTAQLAIVREWGSWTDFRTNPPAKWPIGSDNYINSTVGSQFTALELGTEVLTVPRHPNRPSVGMGAGMGLMTEMGLNVYLRAQVGIGPVIVHGQLLGGLSESQVGSARQLGLTLKLPPYHR